MSEQQQAQQPQPAPRQPTMPQSGLDAPPWWLGLVTERFDAKLDALKERLEGEIKAVESRIESEIKASELRQSEARANQTRWIVATIFGAVGLLVFIDRMWPPGAA